MESRSAGSTCTSSCVNSSGRPRSAESRCNSFLLVLCLSEGELQASPFHGVS